MSDINVEVEAIEYKLSSFVYNLLRLLDIDPHSGLPLDERMTQVEEGIVILRRTVSDSLMENNELIRDRERLELDNRAMIKEIMELSVLGDNKLRIIYRGCRIIYKDDDNQLYNGVIVDSQGPSLAYIRTPMGTEKYIPFHDIIKLLPAEEE